MNTTRTAAITTSKDNDNNQMQVDAAGEDSLAQELGLPKSATLVLPSSSLWAMQKTIIILETLQGNQIHISTETCLRGSLGRALIVGRQAASADLRIQHKSISRQHAVLYYAPVPSIANTNSSNGNNDNNNDRTESKDDAAETTGDMSLNEKNIGETHPSTPTGFDHSDKNNINNNKRGLDTSPEEYSLYLKDLGGKHGTIVNGQRILAHEPVPLKEGDSIQFGNVRESPFVVGFLKQKSTFTASSSSSLTTTATSSTTTKIHKNKNNINKNYISKEEVNPAPSQQESHPQTTTTILGQGLTGRAKREAELAAMMASLDETPTYHSYTPLDTMETTSTSINANNNNNIDNNNDENSNHQYLQQHQQVLAVAQQHRLPVAQMLYIPASRAIGCSGDGGTNSNNNKVIGVRSATTTCLAMDSSGARFVLGNRDSYLRLYDFSGFEASIVAATATTICPVHATASATTATAEPFQITIPHEGYGVVACVYSNTGDRLLVGTASSQPVILDRDAGAPGAVPLLQFVRGDVYLADVSKTMGHTAAITAVDWHPLERDLVLTTSMDGTARLWNLASGKLQFEKLTCDKVMTAKKSSNQNVPRGGGGRGMAGGGVGGQRTAVTSVCFHPGGRFVALGTACGSIQIWKAATSATSSSSRPERVIQSGHTSSITYLTYSVDGTQLASRSCSSSSSIGSDDNQVLIWSTSQSASARMLLSSQPVFACLGLPSLHEQANFCFSPNGQYGCGSATSLVSGTNKDTVKLTRGSLNFYSFVGQKGITTTSASSPPTTLRIEPIVALESEVGGSCPVLVQWHKALNQILVACDDGSVMVYLDPALGSKNGALLALRKVRQGAGGLGHKKEDDALSALLRSRAPQGLAALTGDILTPLASDTASRRKRRYQDEDVAPEKVREPERPASGKHKMGRGGGVPATLQQFVADQSASNRAQKEGNNGGGMSIAGKDPRQALLQYSRPEDAKNRAQKVLDTKTMEQEQQDQKRRRGNQF